MGRSPPGREDPDHGAQDTLRLFRFSYPPAPSRRGSDPIRYKALIDKGVLPAERGSGCKVEHEQVNHAFQTLLAPHIDREARGPREYISGGFRRSALRAAHRVINEDNAGKYSKKRTAS